MQKILVLNSGSSSLKYQLFSVEGDKYTPLAKGLADRIGLDGSFVTIKIGDGDKIVNEYKYKNKVKINGNMAIGLLKNTLIYIFLEDHLDKRSELFDKFYEAMMKFIVPIKPGRKNPRKTNPKNRYHINQRKTF